LQLTAASKKKARAEMSHFDYRISQCRICRLEYTSTRLKAEPGVVIHICPVCLEKAKDHFIWLCLNCGRPYFRLKNLVMNRMCGYGLREARFLYETPLIQGIDFCVVCNPEFIVEYVYTNKERHCSPK
jgi:hypothetical protein